MDREWELSYSNYVRCDVATYSSISEDSNDQDTDIVVSMDAVLPDDLLEKILSFLPVVSLIRCGAVSKRWREAVHSHKCAWNCMMPQRPWYYMLTCSEEVVGYAYDPSIRKWYDFDFPYIEKSNWSTSSSYGLVCLMDSEDRSRIIVCNPITKDWRRLSNVPAPRTSDYVALAISVDRKSHSYTIAITQCKQVPEEYYQWDFTIDIYESESKSWVTPFFESMIGWRGGEDCVICGSVLYYLIYSSGVLGNVEPRHCLVMYDLKNRTSKVSLMSMAIPVPCSLTCGRLMNIGDRLVMVGGIGKHDRPGIIKGIGIWELHRKVWKEVARMPHNFFQRFGEFDDVFASSGAEDLIYIQSFGSTILLTFDMNLKLWRWSVRSPVTKRFPLQLFTGFSFEPRMDVSS